MSYSLFVHPLRPAGHPRRGDGVREQRVGLGLETSDQVDAAIGKAADNPLAFAIIEGMVRRVLCHMFPYAVSFEVDGDKLVVLAVTHVRRDPIAWRSRTTPGKP